MCAQPKFSPLLTSLCAERAKERWRVGGGEKDQKDLSDFTNCLSQFFPPLHYPHITTFYAAFLNKKRKILKILVVLLSYSSKTVVAAVKLVKEQMFRASTEWWGPNELWKSESTIFV